MIFVTWKYPIYNEGHYKNGYEEETCVFDSAEDVKKFLAEHRAHIIIAMWELTVK